MSIGLAEESDPLGEHPDPDPSRDRTLYVAEIVDDEWSGPAPDAGLIRQRAWEQACSHPRSCLCGDFAARIWTD